MIASASVLFCVCAASSPRQKIRKSDSLSKLKTALNTRSSHIHCKLAEYYCEVSVVDLFFLRSAGAIWFVCACVCVFVPIRQWVWVSESERDEAEVCCGIQMEDGKLIFKFEK